MSTAREIVDTIGRAKLREELGVVDTAITNALNRGRLPSDWYIVAKRLWPNAPETLPEHLFTFKKTKGAA